MKKIISLVLALAMILSIASTSAFAFGSSDTDSTTLVEKILGFNPLGSIFSSKDEETAPTLSFSNILANVKKGIDGTGLVYGRDYKVEVSDDSTYGYRIHLIQPTTGVTLYDNYLVYEDGAWTWEKSWNIPEIPTSLDLDAIKTNIYQSLWDSGIYIDLDKDIDITRTSEDGYKVCIVDPLTGRVIYENSCIIEDEKTISWDLDFEPIDEDSVLAAHFPTTDEAEDEMIEEQEEVVEEINEEVVEEVPEEVVEEEVEEVVVDEETPLADAPVVEEESDEIANTGDATFSVMASVAVLAGAAFVATRKHN